MRLRSGGSVSTARRCAQIQRDLLDQQPIGAHRGRRRREAPLEGDSRVVRRRLGEAQHRADQLVQVLLGERGPGRPQEVPQPLDDLAGALCLVAADVHRLLQLAAVGVARLQHAHAAVVVGGNRRERLVELVRDRGGEFAERDEARGAMRGVAVLGEQLARAPLLGDVGKHAQLGGAAVAPGQRVRAQHEPAVGGRVLRFARLAEARPVPAEGFGVALAQLRSSPRTRPRRRPGVFSPPWRR
jgi:hypothetical protein